ncbi:MAG: haloacid dehalogenase type II [Pseudomonadota bacterium]
MATITDLLQRETRALVFDLYGTVVDMQGGLVEIATPFLQDKGWEGDPNQFVTWWRRTHFEDSMIDALCDRGHTPYRQVGHRAVSQVMERAGIAHDQDEVRALVGAIETLNPFPEVVDAMARLKEGYKLFVLSNGDRDMLEVARAHLVDIDFDDVISVQEAGYFKPHAMTYQTAEDVIGLDHPEIERSGILFVANHAFDCIGAKAHGFRTCFINRRNRPFGQSPMQPDLQVETMTALADALCGPAEAVSV